MKSVQKQYESQPVRIVDPRPKYQPLVSRPLLWNLAWAFVVLFLIGCGCLIVVAWKGW